MNSDHKPTTQIFPELNPLIEEFARISYEGYSKNAQGWNQAIFVYSSIRDGKISMVGMNKVEVPPADRMWYLEYRPGLNDYAARMKQVFESHNHPCPDELNNYAIARW